MSIITGEDHSFTHPDHSFTHPDHSFTHPDHGLNMEAEEAATVVAGIIALQPEAMRPFVYRVAELLLANETKS